MSCMRDVQSPTGTGSQLNTGQIMSNWSSISYQSYILNNS